MEHQRLFDQRGGTHKVALLAQHHPQLTQALPEFVGRKLQADTSRRRALAHRAMPCQYILQERGCLPIVPLGARLARRVAQQIGEICLAGCLS